MLRALPGIVGLALVLLLACARDEERFVAHTERAGRHAEQGDLESALLELRNALSIEPKDAMTNFRIAEVLRAQEKYGEALFYYHEARRLDPDHADAYLRAAAILMHADLTQAADLARAAIELDPSDPDAYVRAAEIEILQAAPEEAIASLNRALEVAPDSAYAHFQLGIAYHAWITRLKQRKQEPDPKLFEAGLNAFDRAIAELRDENPWWIMIQRAKLLSAWPARQPEAEGAFRGAVASAVQGTDMQAVVTAAEESLRYSRLTGDDALRRWSLERMLDADDAIIPAWVELARLAETSGESGDAIYQKLLERRPRDERAHVAYARFEQREDLDKAAAGLLRAAEEGVDPPFVLGALADLYYGHGRSSDAAYIVAQLEAEHPEHPRTALARAQRLIAEERFSEASALLREFTGTRASIDGLRLLGVAELQRGNTDAALAAVDRAIEVARRYPVEAHALRARVLGAKGNCRETVAELREVMRRARVLSPVEGVLYARCQFELGYPDEARAVLTRLVAPPNPFLPALVELATRERRNDPARARALLEAGFQEDPGHPAVALRLAEIDLEEQGAERALARLNAALAIATPHPGVLLARARLLQSLGRLEAAEADALAVFEVAPNLPGVIETLVGVRQALGRSEKALALLEQAEQQNRLEPPARVLLARLLAAAGQIARARELYEAALALDDQQTLAKNDLAFLLAEQGEQLDRALALAKQAASALPENPAVLDTLGYVYWRQGLGEAAVTHLEQAIRAAEAQGQPKALHQFHLGLALRSVRRNLSAAQAFERALEIDPAFPHAERARSERRAALAGEPPSKL